MAILTLHGVAQGVDRRRFGFRNLCEIAALRRFLSSVPRLVPLPEALAGGGSALTIDDATTAAANAALLAREYGHAVSLFVNAGQVESGRPYSFVVLNALLDGLDGQPCPFEGTSFPTATTAQRQALRDAIKARLCTVTDEPAREELVRALAAGWRVRSLEVPPHFRTLTKQDLIALRDAGVDLQNHGWSHSHHASLTPEASGREISEGRHWLKRQLGVDAAYFAVPFGDALPPPGLAAPCAAWLTLLDALPPGPLAPGVFNRATLALPAAPAGLSGVAARWPGALARGFRGLFRG
jgi:hypothetical protein